MAKKYRAEHITIFAVYKKFMLMGFFGRTFRIAFPDYRDAQAWVDQLNDAEKSSYMIEEMPAIMKAWQT